MELILDKNQQKLYDKFIIDSSSFISKNIRNNIEKISLGLIEEDYLKEICKCIDFINNKTIDSNFSNEQKQFMSEIIFSEFEYLNENYSNETKYQNIDSFLSHLESSVDLISFNDTKEFKSKLGTANGKCVGGDLIINDKFIDNDKKFMLTFAHEILHIVTDKNDLVYRYDKKRPTHKFDNDTYIELMELQNEKIALLMLEENFGDWIPNEKYINPLREKNGKYQTLETNQKGFVYNELLYFKDILDVMFDGKLDNAHLSSNYNILDVLDELDFEDINKELKTFCHLGRNLIVGNEDYKKKIINREKFDEYYKSFENLLFKYIEFKDISLEKFFDLRDSLKNSSMILLEENRNLMQETLEKLDVYYFSNNIFYDVNNELLEDKIKLNTFSKDIDNLQETLKDFNLNEFIESINNKDITIEDAIKILPKELIENKGIVSTITFNIDEEFQDDFLDKLPDDIQEYTRDIIKDFEDVLEN